MSDRCALTTSSMPPLTLPNNWSAGPGYVPSLSIVSMGVCDRMGTVGDYYEWGAIIISMKTRAWCDRRRKNWRSSGVWRSGTCVYWLHMGNIGVGFTRSDIWLWPHDHVSEIWISADYSTGRDGHGHAGGANPVFFCRCDHGSKIVIYVYMA